VVPDQDTPDKQTQNVSVKTWQWSLWRFCLLSYSESHKTFWIACCF